MASKLSRRHCKLCLEKTGQKYRMEEIGDMERCLQCGAEFSVNTGVLLNKTALERAEKNGSPRVIRHKRPLSSMDPVRFRTRRPFQVQIGIGGMGNREVVKNQDTWKPRVQALHKEPPKKCSVGEPPKYPRRPTEEISEDKEAYRIIIEMPYHQENEIKVDIKEDILSIESNKSDFNYYREFLMPSDVLPKDYKQSFKNGILEIRFKKKKDK